MRRVIHSLLLTALLAAPFVSVPAQESSIDDIRSLDDEVQDVKADALDIAAELNLLEQRLLYPSGTRLTVSLGVGRNTAVQPGAVEIRIDGDLTAHHVYSVSEQEALQKGGVQTLYSGNITAGPHELTVRIIGKLANGASIEKTARHAFTKRVEAKTLDITIDYTGREDDGIRIEDR